jgi:hypothetical protein
MSESSPRRETRRSSSVVNRLETDKETIFFNSPNEKNADIVHEIVPEIKIAKQVFEQPGTVEKVRQVSQQIKTADDAIITRRKSLIPVVASPTDDKKGDEMEVDQSRLSPNAVQKEVSNDQPKDTSSEQGLVPSIAPETAASEIPVMAERGDESKPKAIESIDTAKNHPMMNISTVDTPTTILSRNVMYQENDDTSSDSSSSDSDAQSPQSLGDPSARKWMCQDFFYCCWSRK